MKNKTIIVNKKIYNWIVKIINENVLKFHLSMKLSNFAKDCILSYKPSYGKYNYLNYRLYFIK